MRHYQTGLTLAVRFHDVSRIARGLSGVAATLAVFGQHTIAARLFGASEALYEVIGLSDGAGMFRLQRALGLPEPWKAARAGFGRWQTLRTALEARGNVALPPIRDVAAANAAWAAGRTMPLADAVALALAAEPVDATPPVHAGLSPREREVLRFLAAGQSNRTIATSLSLSERTVENHVQHILTKLGLDSRTAAAAHALREGLI